jgi:hypothetical protein
MGTNEGTSAETNSTHDQIPICAIHIRKGEIQQEQLLKETPRRNRKMLGMRVWAVMSSSLV